QSVIKLLSARFIEHESIYSQPPPDPRRQNQPGPVAPPYSGWAGTSVPAAYGGGPPSGPPPGPPAPPRQGGPGEPRRRTPGAVLVTRIVAVALAAIVLIGCGVGWALTGRLQSNSGTSDAAGNAGNGGVISEEGMTFLLVGSDARTDADGNPLSAEELRQVGTEDDGGGINTDTIMLVHIPQGGGKATAVSLPRDTWIGPAVMDKVVGPYADGTEGAYNPNKINSFYSTAKAYTEEKLVNQGVSDRAQIERESNEAGRTMLIRVVQAFTGMKIDHYAEVNLLGFYLLSNAIGGVPVCLNAAVNDPWSGANFAAGQQEVQGTAALAFVRQRHGLPQGDLDRVRRQQAFLAGAADKILSVGTLTNPSTLNDLVGAIDRSVIFDKGFSVLSFAEQLTNLSSGNINFETLPTTGPETSTNADALATDPEQVKAFFAAIAGGSGASAPGTTAPATTVDPASITVDVQDGTVADGVTARAADIINSAGFALGSLGVVAGTSSGNETQTTEVRYPADALGAAQQVKKAFGVGTLVPDDAIDSGHVLVVVGKDLDVPSGLRAPGAALAPAAAQAPAAALAQAGAAVAPAGVGVAAQAPDVQQSSTVAACVN
ncbi:LCP family protein, partial [Nakamurella sp. GG22]